MNISRLQYITNTIEEKTHPQLVEEACKAGIDWIQLRIKKVGYSAWKQIALDAQEICKAYNVTFIINDNVKLCKEIKADGVHLGKMDIPPHEARKLLGQSVIIGGTANTFYDIEGLVVQEVNYIGLGPYKFTATKEKLSPILGIEGYKEIIQSCALAGITVPIIGIGGITTTDTLLLKQTGIYGIAVSSSITDAEDKGQAIATFKKDLI
ncbi:MAG TPA: thiamine phosphate synthase [Cytophagaceae bacterium]|jgi:thiamine-phosphate pyrophosphorylase